MKNEAWRFGMRWKNARASCIVLATLCPVAGVVAQEAPDLLRFLPSDPNSFVRAVQQKLADARLYDGRISGTLTRSTIVAINSACRGADNLTECQLGPLSPKGSAAVVAALDKLSGESAVPAAAPPADTATLESATAQPTNAEPVAEAALPVQIVLVTIPAVDWSANPSNGLTANRTETNKAVSFAIAGTAKGGGWFNINAGERIAATPDSPWSVTVAADFTGPEGAAATLRIAAQRADGSYITELSRGGTPISRTGTFEVSGIAPPDTAFILPYVQVTYPVGAEASGSLELKAASVAGPGLVKRLEE